MSGSTRQAAAFPRALVGYESDLEATGHPHAGHLRNRAPRIHPALYAFALLSAAILCMLSIAALEGYGPPSRLPGRHDELLSFKQSDRQHIGHSQLDESAHKVHPEGSPKRVSASWNNIANVLGGFSTTYISSPQLNASWIARPAGFGGRIEGQPLIGKLSFMQMHQEDKHIRESLSIDRTGCQIRPGSPLPPKGGLPRIALIERGECQFLTKLLNAQAQGYDAAIVYNDYVHHRQQRAPRLDDGLDGRNGESELISMWSPSREAAFLHIPSVFVSYLTGKTLETLLAVESDSETDAIVIMEPEDTPHL